jgi:hypothetical protein
MHIALLFFSLLYGFFFFWLNIGKGIFRDTQNAIDGPTMARPTGIFFYGFNRSGRRQSKYFMM